MKIQSKWILVCLFLSFALGTIAADLNGIVIRVDDHRVYIDLGENDGVNIGDEFRIISQKNQQEIARLNIKEVFAYAALGDLVEKQPGQEIQLSDPVYRSMEAFFDNTLSENPLQEKRKMKITSFQVFSGSQENGLWLWC